MPRRKTGLSSRTPLARTGFLPKTGTPLKRGAALAQRSAKRRREDRVRTQMKRDIVEVRGELCEVVGWPVTPQDHARAAEGDDTCGRRANDVHEPLTRARGGSITDPSNAVLICRIHHDLIHTNPADAEARGLLKRSA